MSTVALTGASGYVGSLIEAGLPPATRIVRLSRRPDDGDIAWSLGGANSGLADRLATLGVTDLIHAAWDMRSSARGEVERTCVEGSRDLFRAAEAAGIARVIFVSTISAFEGARSVYGQTKLRVERDVIARGGIVLRLGLVRGRIGDAEEGGMAGAIRATVRKSRLVPMIGNGRGPQYCLDGARLQAAIRRALAGDLDGAGQPILLADETPLPFRAIVARIATEEARSPILLPIPPSLLYLGLRTLEVAGLRPPARSDSVTSFVHADPSPDFTQTRRLGL